jgi:uncharacterized membrane protein (GlpM family)
MTTTPATAGDDTGDAKVGFNVGRVREARAREWLIRFGFGAGVSLLAGVVSTDAGPKIGGIFLAFPAILLASLTLVAKEEGRSQARDDARGAAFGAVGLLAFAVVVTVLASRTPMWVTLVAASLAWLVVSLAGYLIARRAGAGGDEPSAADARG